MISDSRYLIADISDARASGRGAPPRFSVAAAAVAPVLVALRVLGLALHDLLADLLHVELTDLLDDVLEAGLGEHAGLEEEQDLLTEDAQGRD